MSQSRRSSAGRGGGRSAGSGRDQAIGLVVLGLLALAVAEANPGTLCFVMIGVGAFLLQVAAIGFGMRLGMRMSAEVRPPDESGPTATD